MKTATIAAKVCTLLAALVSTNLYAQYATVLRLTPENEAPKKQETLVKKLSLGGLASLYVPKDDFPSTLTLEKRPQSDQTSEKLDKEKIKEITSLLVKPEKKTLFDSFVFNSEIVGYTSSIRFGRDTFFIPWKAPHGWEIGFPALRFTYPLDNHSLPTERNDMVGILFQKKF